MSSKTQGPATGHCKDVVPDPLDLAVKSKKWGRTSVDEFEAESEKGQGRITDMTEP